LDINLFYINMDRKRYVSHHTIEFKFLKWIWISINFEWFVSKDLESNLFTLAHFSLISLPYLGIWYSFQPWYFFFLADIFIYMVCTSRWICMFVYNVQLCSQEFVLVLSIQFEVLNWKICLLIFNLNHWNCFNFQNYMAEREIKYFLLLYVFDICLSHKQFLIKIKLLEQEFWLFSVEFW
jgi:hypothetical protein